MGFSAGASRHWFPVSIQVIFEFSASSNESISRWRLSLFAPNTPFQLSWANTCVSPKNPSVLEVAASSTLFPSVNCISFWKGYFLQLRWFKVEIGAHFCTLAYSAELKKHMYVSRQNNICEKLKHLEPCCPVRIVLVFEWNTSCKTPFSECRKAHFVPNRPLSWVEEAQVSLERKSSL